MTNSKKLKSSGVLMISQEDLDSLVAKRVEALLPPQLIEQLAAARIDARIKRLTLEEAMARLGSKNIRRLKEKCWALGIPMRKDLGSQSAYILLADIEAANARSVIVPLEQSTHGTRIGHTLSEIGDRRSKIA